MFAQSHRPSLITGLIALIIGVLAPPAAAQDAGEIAQRCIQAVRSVALNAGDDMHAIAGHTARQIRQLDEDGAANPAILQAGASGRELINTRAQRGLDRIDALVEHCVAELRDLDAPPAMIARVLDAGRDARRAVGMARERAIDRVQAAVRRAIEG